MIVLQHSWAFLPTLLLAGLGAGCAAEPDGCGWVLIGACAAGPIGAFNRSDLDASELHWIPRPTRNGLWLDTEEGFTLLVVAPPRTESYRDVPVDPRYWEDASAALTDFHTTVQASVVSASTEHVAYEAGYAAVDVTFPLPDGDTTLRYELDFAYTETECAPLRRGDSGDGDPAAWLAVYAWLNR